MELALKTGVTFAQFVLMTPFPGTVDFGRGEKEQSQDPMLVEGTPITVTGSSLRLSGRRCSHRIH